jgi:hypothetical protein
MIGNSASVGSTSLRWKSELCDARAEDRHEQQEQREDGDEGVVGEQRGERAGSVVAEL